MILLPPPKKSNEIFHPEVEPMFDDVKRRIVAHRGVPSHTVEADMTMILMMIVLERGIRDVGHCSSSHIWQSTDKEQAIAVGTTHHPVSQARLNPAGNRNAESHWENKHSQPSV